MYSVIGRRYDFRSLQTYLNCILTCHKHVTFQLLFSDMHKSHKMGNIDIILKL